MYTAESPLDADASRAAYAEFLANVPRFVAGMERVISEWPISCQHFLTNDEINRIAWLGQASMFIATDVPAHFRAGFKLLALGQQRAANAAAGNMLREWEKAESKRAAQDQRIHSDMDRQGLLFGHPGRGSGAIGSTEPCAFL